MERLTVERNGIHYLLYNLTTETVRELRSSPERLADYFLQCLEAGENVCVVERNAPIAHITSNQELCVPSQNEQNFDFLCGTAKNRSHIIAIKCNDHPWHYFDEADSISAQHINLLPPTVHVSISKLKSIKSLKVALSQEQAQNYYKDGKFIFKEKELNTCMVLDGKEVKGANSKAKTTKQLVFISGQTNPLLFLNDYEKCSDVKNEQEKMYKLIDFVNEAHKGELTELYFTNNWDSMKSCFLKWYTLPFVQNKKRELKIDFAESNTLRSFFEMKLASLSKFTTMPFINQIEMILNDLPDVISSLFIVNEKMTLKEADILAYCDSIEDLVQRPSFNSPRADDNEDNQRAADDANEDMQMEMEIFDYVSDHPSTSRGARGRVRGRGQRGKRGGGVVSGKVKKRSNSKLKSISEASESSESYSFLNEIDQTSRSSWDTS